MDLANVGTNLAAAGRVHQTLADTFDGRFIMIAKDIRIDELGLVDDPINLLVLARESQEPFEPAMLCRQLVGGSGECLPSTFADLVREIANESSEYRLLRVEIGVEGSKRDAGTLCDVSDTGFMEAALSELDCGRVEDLAQRSLPPGSPRRFSLAC